MTRPCWLLLEDSLSTCACLGVFATVLACLPASVHAQLVVSASQKISSTAGDFAGDLEDDTLFGNAVCRVGDVDGDGIADLAVGQLMSDDGEEGAGAVWILFLDDDGTVRDEQKISATDGSFDGELDADDGFGAALAALGDFDGNGVPDLAVGATGDDDGGFGRGAVWLLFLEDDGTVLDHQKISDTEGEFDGELDNRDRFGCGIASVGDLDGDGVTDIVVGAHLDNDGSEDAGAVWVLFLDDDGTVRDEQKISDWEGEFGGFIRRGDQFGVSVTSLGDLNKDGVTDIAVGALNDDDGGIDQGAVWILFLNDDGTVFDDAKISAVSGRFTGDLNRSDLFGASVLGFKNRLLMVGAPGDDDGGPNQGAIWLLTIRESGTVRSHQKISATAGGFRGELGGGDQFGRSLATVGDVDGDGISDFLAGAVLDDDGGSNRGAAYIVMLGHEFLRGDVDGNGVVAPITDALALLTFAFVSGDPPTCADATDADDNGAVHGIVDALYLFRYGFTDGPLPPDPGVEECGVDDTDDRLNCARDTCVEDD